MQGSNPPFVSISFTNSDIYFIPLFVTLYDIKASNREHHNINEIFWSDHYHLLKGSSSGVVHSRMVWAMWLKTDKLPQPYLIYGLIFPDNLRDTGASIGYLNEPPNYSIFN